MLIEASIGQRFIAFLVFAVGLMLLVLSAPRTVAYAYLAGTPSHVMDALNSGQSVDAAQIVGARDAYLKAHSVLSHDSVILQNLGRLELRHADELRQAGDKSDDAFMSASAYFRASIEAAPARPFPWSLEAYVQSKLQASSDKVNGLLRMSYFLGPHEASSILLRGRVGTRMWDALDEDVRRFTTSDLEDIWHNGRLRWAIVPIYLDASLSTRSAIRKLVVTDSASERRFGKMLKMALVPTKPS
jgi:hypothetical protein